MEEIWKDIPIKGAENYEVSNLGHIRHKQRKKIRKVFDNGNGYEKINIRTPNGVLPIFVHRAVALAFCPNDDPEHKTQVSHLDESRKNNAASNLCWATPSENNQMPLRRKRHSKPVRCIETDIIYESGKMAAEILGLSQGNISRVCRGKANTTGGYHFEFVIDEEE